MEHKIRPIYEALDGRQPKQALKLCDALLKKGTVHLVLRSRATDLKGHIDKRDVGRGDPHGNAIDFPF